MSCSKAEGIFRINAENGQEEYVRNQLNKGFVPRGIDVHCLAGLIKVMHIICCLAYLKKKEKKIDVNVVNDPVTDCKNTQRNHINSQEI